MHFPRKSMCLLMTLLLPLAAPAACWAQLDASTYNRLLQAWETAQNDGRYEAA